MSAMSAFTSYFLLLYFYLSRKLNARLLLVAEYFYTVVLDLTILPPVDSPSGLTGHPGQQVAVTHL